jgi:hypothetical protein
MAFVTPHLGHRLFTRVLLHICDRPSNQVGVIVKGTHGGIAEKADDPAHGPGLVIVIHLFGFSSATYGTQTALPSNELVDLIRANPVTPHQMVVALAPSVVASQ